MIPTIIVQYDSNVVWSRISGTDVKFSDELEFSGSPIRTIEIIKYAREKLPIQMMDKNNGYQNKGKYQLTFTFH